MLAKELVTKKAKVEFIYSDILVEEALEKVEKKRYMMIPVLERGSNRYLYSLSEGDLLRFICSVGSLRKAMKSPLTSVAIERLIIPVREDAESDAIFDLIVNQNYVPVIDGNGVFQGIATRRAMLNALRPQSTEEGE